MRNIDIVNRNCEKLDRLGNTPNAKKPITHAGNGKGHDMRYKIDPAKTHEESGCLSETMFVDGIKKQFSGIWKNAIGRKSLSLTSIRTTMLRCMGTEVKL